jgi:peptidoglycan-associated lipoprotein
MRISRTGRLVTGKMATLLALGAATSALAQEEGVAPENYAAVTEDDEIARGGFYQPWLFGGIDFGYAKLAAPGEAAGEPDKSGYQAGIKGLFSYYWPRYTFDAGLGFNYNRIRGGDSSIRIITQSGYAELAGRYRFNDHWSAGPLVNFLYGTDTGFSQSILTDRDQFSVHGGLQGFYEMPLKTWLVRFGLRATTDLDISGRQLWVTQGAVQIGLPLKIGTPIRTSAEAYVAEPEPDLKVSLDLERIHFDTAKATLPGSVDRALRAFGEFLAANPEAWGVLRVDGHTDERGSFGYNLNLSYQRARSVRGSILSGGVPSDQVQARGFSFTQPVVAGSNEQAWARNRRVELRFYKVTDAGRLREGLSRLQKDLDSGR